MKDSTRTVMVVLISSGATCVLLVALVLLGYFLLRDPLIDLRPAGIQQLSHEMSTQYRSLREDLFSLELAAIVDRVSEGAKTPQEKALRLGEWVASHISNIDTQKGDYLTALCHRRGFCGTRSELFVRMLQIENIHARRFNMIDFPRAGASHACAQAYWDGAWHFFDVTYAGVFIKNGEVLSWDEIASAPADALEHLVVFDSTRDTAWNRERNPLLSRRVHNVDRMKSNYSVASLTNPLLTWGFRSDPKTLSAPIDLAREELPVVIGAADAQADDVKRDGIALGLTGFLNLSLGTLSNNFYLDWIFSNVQPGTYEVEYLLYEASADGLAFRAQAQGARVLAGSEFVSTPELCAGEPTTWPIRFSVPEPAGKVTLSIHHEIDSRDSYVTPDRITIRRLGGPMPSGDT